MPMDRTAFYADASTAASVATITAAMADAEADSIAAVTAPRQIQMFRPANAAALAALATTYTLQAGDRADQLDTAVQYRWSGAAWVQASSVSAWTTYTPTLTNFVIGTGGSASSVSRYRYVGTMIEVDYKYVLGTSGASVSNVPRISLPVTANASYAAYTTRGVGSFIDSSAGPVIVVSYALIFNTTTAALHHILTPTPVPAVPTLANPSATAPFTWAAGDILAGSFTYEP